MTELFLGIEERALDAETRARIESYSYQTRLDLACWVCAHIIAHSKDPGTYRVLIYNRMGFGPDAYVPLQIAGALAISNAGSLIQHECA